MFPSRFPLSLSFSLLSPTCSASSVALYAVVMMLLLLLQRWCTMTTTSLSSSSSSSHTLLCLILLLALLSPFHATAEAAINIRGPPQPQPSFVDLNRRADIHARAPSVGAQLHSRAPQPLPAGAPAPAPAPANDQVQRDRPAKPQPTPTSGSPRPQTAAGGVVQQQQNQAAAASAGYDAKSRPTRGADLDKREAVKRAFVENYDFYERYAFGSDMLKPATKVGPFFPFFPFFPVVTG